MVTGLFSCTFNCGSGNIVTENRNTGSFSGVSVGGAFEVEVNIGDITKVEVEADDNLIGDIKTSVSGDMLEISSGSLVNLKGRHYKVYVTTPVINTIKSTGAADIEVKGMLFNNTTLFLESSGASNIKATVDGVNTDIVSSGASEITLSGRTKKLSIEASGSSSIAAKKLQTPVADVSTSGSADTDVNVTESLKASASGASSINYFGNPSKVEKTESGSGSIDKDIL